MGQLTPFGLKRGHLGPKGKSRSEGAVRAAVPEGSSRWFLVEGRRQDSGGAAHTGEPERGREAGGAASWHPRWRARAKGQKGGHSSGFILAWPLLGWFVPSLVLGGFVQCRMGDTVLKRAPLHPSGLTSHAGQAGGAGALSQMV